jgi:hypothetical protein
VFALATSPRFTLATLYAIAGAFTGRSPILFALRGMGRAMLAELRALRTRTHR